uniref:RanBP2-type domain-containing protein n=1 Tax=Physcomitrium patens TaxID=3218 RepID=A0A7I4DAD0_PHYPA
MYGGREESGGHYAYRLPKHPRLTRMQGFAEHMNGEAGPMQRGKQPRPLEDGNWVCDEPSCGNVNYPRRTECNKCGKRRGLLGDAVVKAYIDTIKIARDMAPGSGIAPHLQMSGGDQGGMLPRNLMSHMGAAETQQSGMSISPGSSHATVGDMEHWMGGGFDTPLLPSFASHYVTGDSGASGRRFNLSAATEGKRLAEQLVASFAASIDPVGDAGECLASAALWLQTMKSRMQTGESGGGLETSSTSCLGSASCSLGLNSPMSGYSTLSQSNLSGNFGPGGFGNLAINSGPGLPHGNTLGNYLARANLGEAVGSPSGVRGIMGRPGLRFEDYKDRPSDFLREFGDPAAVNATAMGGGHKPEPGINGNWECEDCKNVNFPRRTNCFQCHKRRGLKGDEVVRKYVRTLIEDPGSLRT